jgi:general secretion pathway protein G
MKQVKRTVRRNSSAGITLIEMLVVVTIIALFGALVGVNLLQQGDKAKVTAAKVQINNFGQVLTLYKLDTGTFPSSEQGLRALRVRPENAPQWNGPYLKQEVPNDPWGRPYAYKYPGEHGDEPDIISLGADGQAGGDGPNADIVSWSTPQQ